MKMDAEWLKNLADEVTKGNVRVTKNDTESLSIYNYTPKTQFSEHWNDITRKTRGLVLDDNGNIVIKCVEKFFNVGEKFAAPVDLTNANYSCKADGYLIQIKLDSDWGLIITSRGSFDNKYVEAAKKFITDDVILKMAPNYTYFCELLQNFPGDEAIILTKHPISKLVCWAVKDENFDEVPLDDWCPFPTVEQLSLAEAKLYLEQKVEGVVAQDPNTLKRVKIKTNYYLENHRLISDCTKKRAWEVLSSGGKIEDLDIPDEFMPQMEEYAKELTSEYQLYWKSIMNAESETSHLTDKELGLLDDYKDLKPFLFLLRKDKGQECLSKIWEKIKPRNMV